MPFLDEIDWVFFDLDGTLWDHDNASMIAMKEVSEAYEVDPHRFFDEFRKANQIMWARRTKENLPVAQMRLQRVEMALTALGRADIDAAEISERYLSRYLGIHSVLPGAADAISHAAWRCKVAVVTNGLPDTQEEKLAQFQEIARLVEFMHCSDENGMMKPHAHYFEAARQTAENPDPERILMVGDSWEEDILTPRQLGWRTVWISHGRKLPADHDGVLAIKGVQDLIEL